ncbi:uncharacterized protein LOC128746523 [Synchiropus splendidus]|uniref:uncharacterized protein LOC128746523 n=1 Tax=Synchiropus splendidus TaxID=270530 RepID=UPI00237E3BB6|nr:uncharacterized protein LOC128746523 [Synchiropus splendidus]
MASTPSGSALTAVLRCRRNVWARNKPSKRPPPAGYSLGLAGVLAQEAPAERGRGARIVVRARLAVNNPSHELKGNMQTRARLKDCFSKLRGPDPEEPVGGDFLRHLARKVISSFRGADRHPSIVITHVCPAQVYQIVLVQEITEQFGESRCSGSSIVSRGWSTLRDTCLSLTTMLSDVMFRKLAGLCLPSRWRRHTSQRHRGDDNR